MEARGVLRGTGIGVRALGEGVWASLVAQLVKNPPAMRETRVRSLGWEDPPDPRAPPKSTVCLTSQRHPEKLPEVTSTSQGNPGFPAATLERHRKSFFNPS